MSFLLLATEGQRGLGPRTQRLREQRDGSSRSAPRAQDCGIAASSGSPRRRTRARSAAQPAARRHHPRGAGRGGAGRAGSCSRGGAAGGPGSMAGRSLRAAARLSVGAARQGRCVGAGPLRPRAGGRRGAERDGTWRRSGAGLGAAGPGLSLSRPVPSCWVSRAAPRSRAVPCTLALPAGRLPVPAAGPPPFCARGAKRRVRDAGFRSLSAAVPRCPGRGRPSCPVVPAGVVGVLWV